ncbi:ParA family protein [Vibrio sp. S4M6]|uniref:ParA family protein n=1 Tax=Vibrio sinus TaxID=2946865 RepID=UPI00202A1E4C|nr:ParA family protein [Vibrio sinus]
MNEVERLKQIALNMQQEQLSRKEIIEKQTSVDVSDDQVDGIDRLIYNHCLNKKTLREHTRLAPATFQKRIQAALDNNVITEPIYQNKQHLFTRHDILSLIEHWGFESYKDKYLPRVIAVENQKGGTGKSTTTALMSTAAALDLDTNARVLLIDLDPQGTLGQGMITRTVRDDAIYLTAIDLVLGELETQGDYRELIDSGYTESDIIKNAPFNTHLPNLDVLPAFATDERFHDIFWQSDDETKDKLIARLASDIVPVLQESYDLIFIDTPPQESPLIWAANEALDCLLIPISPREYDYSSTTNYLLTTASRFDDLPSKGKNLVWSRVLVVNHDEKVKAERDTVDKLSRTVQDKLLSSYIVHSELMVAAAELNRTPLDVMKSEKLCSSKKYDDAIASINSVYKQIIRELKAVSVKTENE